MEQWESLVELFPSIVDYKHVNKALKTADVVLKAELADFEIDWIIRTLFLEPVNLFSVIRQVSQKQMEHVWIKVVETCFKQIAELFDRFPTNMEVHLTDIVELCELPFSTEIRKNAYHCLATSVRVSRGASVSCVTKYVNYLDNAETCKAPLAVLVGTLCQYCGETLPLVDLQRCLTIYLNMLQSKKNSDTVIQSIFIGVSGLLQHDQADELPTNKLCELYQRICDYMDKYKCEDICLKLLEDHALIFREWITRETRERAWGALRARGANGGVVRQCIRALYAAECQKGKENGTDLQAIINEVKPFVGSSNIYVKYTALRVLSKIQNSGVNVGAYVNVHNLEFELQRGKISYEIAEAISLCIEANVEDSEKLLETAILYYEHIPEARRRRVVVDSILNASAELRSAAVTYLAMETCRGPDFQINMDKYIPLWRELFEGTKAELATLMLVFEDLTNYVVFVIQAALSEGNEDGWDQILPPSVDAVTRLLTSVVTLPSSELYAGGGWLTCYDSLVVCALRGLPSSVAALSALSAHVWDDDVTQTYYQMLDLEKCYDECLLRECCKAVVNSPDGAAVDLKTQLDAIKIIFSRLDVDPEILLSTLHKFEYTLKTQRDSIDDKCIVTIINLLEKIQTRRDMNGKHARTLRRELLMFLGKYGGYGTYGSIEDCTSLVKLKAILDVVSTDGFKLNVQSILQLAIDIDDVETMAVLYRELCDMVRSGSCLEGVEHAMSLVLHAICRAEVDADADILAAAAAVTPLLVAIAMLPLLLTERSPGVRRKMCAVIADVASRPSEKDSYLPSIIEQAIAMMHENGANISKQAGLELTEYLLPNIKENNSLITEYLPDLLISIISTENMDINCRKVFEDASGIFIDKIYLLEDQIIDEVVKKLLQFVCRRKPKQTTSLLTSISEHGMIVFKRHVNMCLVFIKSVVNEKCIDNLTILKKILDELHNFGHFGNYIYVCAEFGKIFDFKTEYLKNKKPYYEYINNVMESIVGHTKYIGDGLFLDAVFNFIIVYQCALDCEMCIKFLSGLIQEIEPYNINRLHKKIKICVLEYGSEIFADNFKTWFVKLEFENIFNNMDDLISDSFIVDYAIRVKSLRIMLDIFYDDSSFLKDLMHNIPHKICRLYEEYFTDSKPSNSVMECLTDFLSATIKFVDLKDFILKAGIDFCRLFLPVFAGLFLEKPFLLLDDEMSNFCVLLMDIVKYMVKRKHSDNEIEAILRLTDEVWPKYESCTNYIEKKSLLVNLSHLPRGLDTDSKPLQWVVRTITTEASEDVKTELIRLLPGGEEFSETYKSYTIGLPSRMSEVRGSVLRTLLDSLAATRDTQLLRIVAALVAGEKEAGWWDEALLNTAAEMARSNAGDVTFLCAVYDQCWGEAMEAGAAVCDKLMVPLLRFSTSSACEKFYSEKYDELLSKLSRKQPTLTADYTYCMHVLDYVRALTILQVAFEKIEATSLESPTSTLYSRTTVPLDPNTRTPKTWSIIKDTCKWCASLIDKVSLPDDAGDDLKKDYILFRCAAYNCLCAAICRYKPKYHIYNKFIFNATYWYYLVDPQETYSLPIRSQFHQRSRRHGVSVASPTTKPQEGGTARTLTSHTTLRSRIFMETLSENPLQYDLLKNEDVSEVLIQDIELVDNALNCHPCTPTLTALWGHATTLGTSEWCIALSSALERCHKNVRWLLAQSICNSKQELREFSSKLSAALLAVIVDTYCDINGKKVLNGLHLDILETLILWHDETKLPETLSPLLKCTIDCIIITCMENRHRQNIYKYTLDVLVRFLNAFENCDLCVQLDIFNDYLNERTAQNECYKLLLSVTKKNIYIKGMLPTLMRKINCEHPNSNDLSKMTELIGVAMSACREDDVKMTAISDYETWLKKIGANTSAYIKALYYAQMGCNLVCKKSDFKRIVSLVPAISGAEKNKCLKIISNYLSNEKQRDSYIDEMFETTGVQDLLAEGCIEALGVVREGVGLMDVQLKKQLMVTVVEATRHPTAIVRRAAYSVVLKAAEELLNSLSVTEPAFKRKADMRNVSKLLHLLHSGDAAIRDILACLGLGVVDSDVTVSSKAREWITQSLDDNLSVRFYELFYLVIYLPSSLTNDNTNSSCISVTAMLDLYFHDRKLRDSFNKQRPRDPIDHTLCNSSSTYLTKSKMVRSSFRSSRTSGNRVFKRVIAPSEPETINVVTTILVLTKRNPSVSHTLFLEVLKGLLVMESSAAFDFREEVVKILANQLEQGLCDVTPLAIEACRVVITYGNYKFDERLETIARRLLKSTAGTEGEGLTRLLVEDLALRSKPALQMVLGSPPEEQCDITMQDASKTFDIDDLMSTFGKLSDWDSLRIQDKSRIRADLPPLWTSYEQFDAELQNYAGESGWFHKMYLSYSNKCVKNAVKWLSEEDRWPRKQFNLSAVTESILWQELHSQEDIYKLEWDIRPEDCLAAWSARLMIRKAYLQLHCDTNDTESNLRKVSRLHELNWCARANEMAMPSLVLQCVERNTGELQESEKMPWLHEYLVASRLKGVNDHDITLLKDTLSKATEYFSFDDSAFDIGSNMNKLILMLHKDFNTLSTETLEQTVEDINTALRNNPELMSKKAKRSMKSLIEYIMMNYDELWPEEGDINVYIKNMCDMFEHLSDLGGTGQIMLLSLILNRLNTGVVLNESASYELCNKLYYRMKEMKLDYFTIEFLKRHEHCFTSLSLVDMESEYVKYKRNFELLCDVMHSFKSYVHQLEKALRNNDSELWSKTSDRMLNKLFENEYAGSDYKQLSKYKHVLYEIRKYDPSNEFKNKAKGILDGLPGSEAKGYLSSEDPNTLHLFQLSKYLSNLDTHTQYEKECLSRLLGLPPRVTVLKFDNQLTVFTDSIRRPLVLRALLSTGVTRRYIVKGGEELSSDAAAQRLLTATAPTSTRAGYAVTLLSEDSALLEFLEDHKRIGQVVKSNVLNDVLISKIRSDSKLLTSRETALKTYQELCAKQPVHALRSVIECHSTSVQEFISKKKRYTETLTDMTLLCWLLGVGDRHLSNIMYCLGDGSVRSVDWGSSLMYGGGDAELPPARLTGCMLAPCDVNVLEAQMQNKLFEIRNWRRPFLAHVQLSYKWMGTAFDEKFSYITDLVCGTSLPHHITERAIIATDKHHKEIYVKLLDELFEDYQQKDSYSVEDQVSCLLRHCTHPSVLSVTRNMWEPWV